MTRDDFGFVGKGEQTALDGVNDLFAVSTGEIGSANTTGEERVAREDHLERSKVETDRALGMAGGVEDLGRIVC